MPKVNNSQKVSQEKLCTLLSSINVFFWELRKELLAIRSDNAEYDPPIDFLKQAHDTSALQPKVHGLMGVHLMIMMIKQGEKNKAKNKKLDKMVWEIGDFIVKLMTDI